LNQNVPSSPSLLSNAIAPNFVPGPDASSLTTNVALPPAATPAGKDPTSEYPGGSRKFERLNAAVPGLSIVNVNCGAEPPDATEPKSMGVVRPEMR
jgi:hypothetical protein